MSAPPHEPIAWLDNLTTPDSEDWNVILDGKTVHVMAFQEDPTPMGRKLVSVGLFEVPLTFFEKRVRLSDKGNRPLGCITVIICRDNSEAAHKLIGWLTRIARIKYFSVLYLFGNSSTAEAVKSQREGLHHVPAGFTSISSITEGRA